MLLLSLLSFSKLCLSMNSLPASTRPSLSSFSDCARHWLFSQVAPVANFYFKLRTSVTLSQVAPVADFYFRLRTSLTFSQVAPVADFAPGFACRWLFFRVAGVRRWFTSQVAHIFDFSPRSRPLLIFSRLRTSLICFSWSHDSVADFSFRLCLSITSFSQVAPVTHRSRQLLSLLFFSKFCLSMIFLPARTSSSLTSFSGCAHRWLFPGRARRWFFPRLRMSLIFFPGRTSTSMTSFLGCANRWFFHWSRPLLIFPQVTHVADLFFLVVQFPCWLLFQIVPVNDFFFTGRASRKLFFHVGFAAVIFFQVVLIDGFFASSHESFVDFFFRLRPSLFFVSQIAPVADFYFRLRIFFLRSRPSLILPQVTHVAGFFHRSRPSLISISSCAHRWLFPRSRPLLISISGCAHHWLFPRSRPSLILPQVLHVADYFSGSQEYVDDSLLRLRISLTFLPGRARCWFSPGYARRWFVFPGRTIPSLTSLSDCACRLLLFHRSRQSLTGRASSCRCYFFPSFAYRWFFCRLARVLRWLPFQVAHIADFSQVAPVADFSPGYACRWFFFRVARVRQWLPS